MHEFKVDVGFSPYLGRGHDSSLRSTRTLSSSAHLAGLALLMLAPQRASMEQFVDSVKWDFK